MKVAIVGGGFTGCLMAIYAAQKGYEVTLFESGAELGGVLRDVNIDGRYFYNGCQYLGNSSLESAGLLSNLFQFSHEYGSVTGLGNRKIRVLDDCSQPALDGKAFVSTETSIDQSALTRLKSYGYNSRNLTQWASHFGDLSKLDWRCLIAMQIERIYFPEDSNLSVLKLQNERANQLTAIPRRLRMPNQDVEAAWLPSQGFNAMFKKIGLLMKSLGVTVNLHAPVKPLINSDHFRIYSRGFEYSPNLTIWANNPTPLLKKICSVSLITPPIRMRLMFGELKKGEKLPFSTPYYWQVFDETSNVVRLYIYEMQGAIRYTAEAFSTGSEAASWNNLDSLMQQIGLFGSHKRCGMIEQLRYVNFSVEEYNAIESATPTLLQMGIIPGAWQHYGREEKIRHIKHMFDEFI